MGNVSIDTIKFSLLLFCIISLIDKAAWMLIAALIMLYAPNGAADVDMPINRAIFGMSTKTKTPKDWPVKLINVFLWKIFLILFNIMIQSSVITDFSTNALSFSGKKRLIVQINTGSVKAKYAPILMPIVLIKAKSNDVDIILKNIVLMHALNGVWLENPVIEKKCIVVYANKKHISIDKLNCCR